MENFSRESSPEIFLDCVDNSVSEVTNGTARVGITIDDIESEISSSLPSNSQASSLKESDYDYPIYKCLPKSRNCRNANSVHAKNISFSGRHSNPIAGSLDCNENMDDNDSNISSSFPSDSQTSLHRCSQASSLKESDWEPSSEKDLMYANRKAYRKNIRSMPYRLQRTYLSNEHWSPDREQPHFDGGYEISPDDSESDIMSSCPSDSQSSLFPSQSSIKDPEENMILSQESNNASSSCYMADISSTATDSVESLGNNSSCVPWKIKKNYKYRSSKPDNSSCKSYDDLYRTTTDCDIFSLTSISESDCEQLNVSVESSENNIDLQNEQILQTRSRDFESIPNKLTNEGPGYPSTSTENPNPYTTLYASHSALKIGCSRAADMDLIPSGYHKLDEKRKVLPKRKPSHLSDNSSEDYATTERSLSDKENEVSDVSSHKTNSSDASIRSEKLIGFSKKRRKRETDDESLSGKDTDAVRISK